MEGNVMRAVIAAVAILIISALSPAVAATSWPEWKAELQVATKEKDKGISDLATRFRERRCGVIKGDEPRRDCQNQYSIIIGKRMTEKVVLEKMIAAIDLKPNERDAALKVLEPLYKELDASTTAQADELNKKFPEPQQAAELEQK